MDAEMLRTILEEQAKQQQAMFTRTVSEIMTSIHQLMSNTQPAATTSPAEFVVNSLSTRIPEFAYDPDNGCTFDVWYNRYEDIISNDGASLEDAARARLIVSKLDATTYARFTNHVLPRKASEISLEDTVKTLKELFGHTTSIFARRYAYLRTQHNGETLQDYTGLVNRRHEMAELNNVTPEQMKCLVWICGLSASEDADIRARALRKMEDNPQTTLKELYSEIQRFLDIRQDVTMLGETQATSHNVNVVKSEANQKEPPSPCFRCGGQHWAKDCSFIRKKCFECKIVGHKKGFCRNFGRRKKPSRRRKAVNNVVIASTSSNGYPANRIFRHVYINGRKVRMRLDTGADVTLLSNADWIAMGRPKLLPSDIILRSANNKRLAVRGRLQCSFKIGEKQGEGRCYVADTPSLLGLDWISQHQPLLQQLAEGSVNNVSTSTLNTLRSSLIAQLRRQFADVFAPGLGRCTKSKVKLVLTPDAKPVFRKARPVPYAHLPKISQEIDRLVATDVLSPVDYSEWAAPIVAVQQKNGTIRLCADYSTGLNDALEQHQHPLPTPDDIFAKLNGGRYFTQLDLSEAYLQLELDDECKPLLAINTHRGLFRFNRLPFGVKPAPGIFQQQMDALVAGLDGTAAYLDDILVTGRSIDEHNTRLKEVFQRIQDYGFHVRLEKCSFLQPEVKYLGFIISADGRRPLPDRVDAISKIPHPKNVSQLRAFLGLINFYGTFVKDLHNLRAPLDTLTRKDATFTWSPECQSSFNQIKAILKSDLLLTHFDPKLPTVVAADASDYGIGAVLSHRFPDGSEKAVYHASRRLTPAQRNYSQIEKEALALIFAVQKFHRFIHGRHFTLKTDHKPLVSIFGSKKGIPVYTANRLQRWATTLLNYNFTIEYVNTKEFGQVDSLSRLIASQPPEAEDRVIAAVDVDVIAEFSENCFRLPVSAEAIRIATEADNVIKQVIGCTRSGRWPKVNRDCPLWSYYNRRGSLSTVNGCLMTANRIVIPKPLQRRVLSSLHKAHPGQTRMKMLARSYVYWPSMDADVEEIVRNCSNCVAASKDPVKSELYSWPKPTSPWTRVHADFAGPLDGKYYLVIVDAFSKWPEIIPMNCISSTSTINTLRTVFAQFGNPQTLVTDNGTQFTSKSFLDFCRSRGITHVRTPPFHPQSNGQAERLVDTFKRGLSKLKGEEPTGEALQTFLMAYHSTPCPSGPNQLSPAENFLARRIRTELDLMTPTVDAGHRDNKMEAQFNRYHGARRRSFEAHDAIFAKDYRGQKHTWTPGIILRRIGNATYSVRCGNYVWTRHVNQLKPRSIASAANRLLDAFDLPLFSNRNGASTSSEDEGSTSSAPNTTTLPRRSQRHRRPPRHLQLDPRQKRYH